MLSNNSNRAKLDPSGVNTAGIDHARLQRVIIMALGLLTMAVFATSCTNQKSCSAYQSVEVTE